LFSVDELIRTKGGIRLDIACGAACQPNFVGMDIRPLPGVDIVHDLNVYPWPLPDGCALVAIASHIVEHIPPVAIGPDGTWFPFIRFMDEVWRILKPAGQFAISTPHGHSQGFRQDPTNINAMDEGTFVYFDPEHPSGMWAGGYRPKPWKIVNLTWSPTGNIECVLEKREDIYE
jgi:SAM-dependent methyltransferase